MFGAFITRLLSFLLLLLECVEPVVFGLWTIISGTLRAFIVDLPELQWLILFLPTSGKKSGSVVWLINQICHDCRTNLSFKATYSCARDT